MVGIAVATMVLSIAAIKVAIMTAINTSRRAPRASLVSWSQTCSPVADCSVKSSPSAKTRSPCLSATRFV